MSVHADFSEVTMLAADLEAKSHSVAREVNVAMRKAGHDIAADAQQLVPVDTAATKNSIFVDEVSTPEGGFEVRIGPTTHYAPHLEHGTVRAPAQPFMFPAAERQVPSLVEAVAQIGVTLRGIHR